MFIYIRSAAFIIVVTQKLVLQQSKNVTAKCTETLLPPPFIQFSFLYLSIHLSYYLTINLSIQIFIYYAL